MIDSHCHLADAKFADLPDVLRCAKAAGVERMVCIADSVPEAEKCVELADAYPELFCTVGVHPHNAKDWQKGDEKKLEALVKTSNRVKGIGEIGLDYHYNLSSPEIQKTVFRTQLTLAKEWDLPVVVHNRESIADLWRIVSDVKPRKLVLHCCTEKWQDVEKLVAAGYFLSFTGIATYPKSDVIRETIKHCPLEQMMIETDAPYLAPVPYRGKRNEPAFVVEVAKLIADVKATTVDAVDRATTIAACAFFALPD